MNENLPRVTRLPPLEGFPGRTKPSPEILGAIGSVEARRPCDTFAYEFTKLNLEWTAKVLQCCSAAVLEHALTTAATARRFEGLAEPELYDGVGPTRVGVRASRTGRPNLLIAKSQNLFWNRTASLSQRCKAGGRGAGVGPGLRCCRSRQAPAAPRRSRPPSPSARRSPHSAAHPLWRVPITNNRPK
eukprot:SAG11_NODE_1838_length_4187_cov_3.622554_2_plen_187_part_00